MAIFQTDEERRSYLNYLGEEAARFEVEILAWCIMTNHVYFIAVPKKEDSLARAFGEAHRRYTRMKNFREGVRGYLFQGRFSSCVLDESHLLAATSYVELNPVRAGIVKKAWGYPWSSAAFHIGQSQKDPLVKDQSLRGLIRDWKDFLAGASTSKDETIRKMTHTGRPVGSAGFVRLVERLTACDLSKGKPGRPFKSPK